MPFMTSDANVVIQLSFRLGGVSARRRQRAAWVVYRASDGSPGWMWNDVTAAVVHVQCLVSSCGLVQKCKHVRLVPRILSAHLVCTCLQAAREAEERSSRRARGYLLRA